MSTNLILSVELQSHPAEDSSCGLDYELGVHLLVVPSIEGVGEPYPAQRVAVFGVKVDELNLVSHVHISSLRSLALSSWVLYLLQLLSVVYCLALKFRWGCWNEDR